MRKTGVWMDGMSRMDGRTAQIASIPNVPEGRTVRTIIPFGVPEKEVTQKEKRPFDDRVVWEHF